MESKRAVEECFILPAPASTRYRSAAELLAAAEYEDDTPTG